MPAFSKEIRNAPIVITGASGWIGSAMLAALARILGTGWEKQVRLFGSHPRMLRAPDGTELAVRALDNIASDDLDHALVVHLAYLTKEKASELGEQPFIDMNRAIDDALLNALAQAQPRAIFVASSGAAALVQGGLDRHPYGAAKLCQEERFLAWGAQTRTPVLAGRIFNLAGPYINKIDSYAVGSFIAQAERTGQIHITATTPVFRSYLSVDDLCTLVLRALANGIGRGHAIDLCGAEVLEMADIAAAVVDAVGGKIVVTRGEIDYLAPSSYLGNPIDTKLLAMELGIRLAPFPEQVAATCAWMRGRTR